MKPEELIDQVVDEETFLEFVHVLEADRRASIKLESERKSSPYGPDALGWENVSVESFLESAAAWAEASQFGRKVGLNDVNPWRRFAQFLLAGKSYE